MKKKTKERRDTEKELLYYLQIYNELKGRNEVERVLSCLGDEIDKLVHCCPLKVVDEVKS